MASISLVYIGEITACNLRFSSFISMDTRLKKTPKTLLIWPPDISSARMVLSKVGGSGLSAMVAISSRNSRIAPLNAGMKCESLIDSKDGIPNGVPHSWVKGLPSSSSAVTTISSEVVSTTSVGAPPFSSITDSGSLPPHAARHAASSETT